MAPGPWPLPMSILVFADVTFPEFLPACVIFGYMLRKAGAEGRIFSDLNRTCTHHTFWMIFMHLYQWSEFVL